MLCTAFLMCVCVTSACSQNVSSTRSSSSFLSPPDTMSLTVPSGTTRGRDVVFPKGTAMEIGFRLARDCDSSEPDQTGKITSYFKTLRKTIMKQAI